MTSQYLTPEKAREVELSLNPFRRHSQVKSMLADRALMGARIDYEGITMHVGSRIESTNHPDIDSMVTPSSSVILNRGWHGHSFLGRKKLISAAESAALVIRARERWAEYS